MIPSRDHAAGTLGRLLPPPPYRRGIDSARISGLAKTEFREHDLPRGDLSEGRGTVHADECCAERNALQGPSGSDSGLDIHCAGRNNAALRQQEKGSPAMRRRNSPNSRAGRPALTPAVPSIDGRWFTSTLSDRRMSQRKLAKLMGVDPASIHRLFTGKRPMRMDEATQIARLLSVPVADVLEHAGVSVQEGQRTVPVVGYVDGQGEAHLNWDALGERALAPTELPSRAVAVQLRTAASALDAMDGWTLFTTLPEGVASDAVGRLCLVGLHGNGVALLRFVRRGYKPKHYNLMHPGLGDLQDAALDWAVPVLHIRP